MNIPLTEVLEGYKLIQANLTPQRWKKFVLFTNKDGRKIGEYQVTGMDSFDCGCITGYVTAATIALRGRWVNFTQDHRELKSCLMMGYRAMLRHCGNFDSDIVGWNDGADTKFEHVASVTNAIVQIMETVKPYETIDSSQGFGDYILFEAGRLGIPRTLLQESKQVYGAKDSGDNVHRTISADEGGSWGGKLGNTLHSEA